MLKKIFLILTILPSLLLCSKINILYDARSDGSIDPSSVWIVKMIKEAGKENNIEINFEGASWSRALELLKDGFVDGLINASYKQSRAEFSVYPFKNGKLDLKKSLKAPAYYLYKHIDNPLDFDGKKLINANGNISAIKSYAVVDNLKSLNANIVYGLNTISNLNDVLYKKNIATAELSNEADFLINSNEKIKQNIVKLPIPIRKKEYFLIFSKKYYASNSENAKKVWNSIEKLKNSTKYRQKNE